MVKEQLSQKIVGDEEVSVLNPQNILAGTNNMVTEEVFFNFGQIDYKTAYMCFDDAKNPKFEPPLDLMPR